MKKLAVFASGSGTNAENIARTFHNGNQIRVSVVLCNRKQAGVYERMQALGVPVIYLPNSAWDSDPQRVIATLAPYAPDMIVLAGFMRAVRPEIIEAFEGRVVNIHPSLLPAYGGKGMYGHHVHEAVIAAGEAKSGVSVHYVTEEIDGGEIIMQEEIPLTPEDTAQTLEEKVHPVEYSLYPRAIARALREIEEREKSPSSNAVTSDFPASEGVRVVEPTPPPNPRVTGHAEHAQRLTPEQAHTTGSPDEQWAQALHISQYSDDAARRAQERLDKQTQAAGAAAGLKTAAIGQATPNYGAAPQTAGQKPAKLALLHPAVAEAVARGEKLPKSYMWVSIVMAVLFSTIPGIIAIVFSAMVGSRLSCGDIPGAERASRTAQAWCIAAFVLGVLSATVWVPVSLLFN